MRVCSKAIAYSRGRGNVEKMNKWRQWQILAVGAGLAPGMALAFASFVGWLAGVAAGFLVLGSACLFSGLFLST